MATSPNYRFNRSPQFSVNHISDYFATTNAPQRTKVIRAAKFPRKTEVVAYSQIRKSLSDALSLPNFGRDRLDFIVDRMENKARRESGYQRDEALRCAMAVRSFQKTFNPKSFSKVCISPSSKQLSTRIEGVKLNVSLDAQITVENGDVTYSGGIVLVYAFSANRGSLKDRLATVSGLVLWALEGGQMEPLPRLCMAADIAEQEIVKASPSHARFRERIAESCKEIVARWDEIEPPHDYDGPDWR